MRLSVEQGRLTRLALGAGWLGLLLLAPAGSAAAWPKEHECTANHSWGDAANYAETREARVASAAVNAVNPGQNGSVRVHGWEQTDVLVKACIQTSADSETEAKQLASEVQIVRGPGQIEAAGPENQHGRSWSVSYEIWMPARSGAKVEAFNGSIAIEGLRGELRFHTLNGSVHLSDVGGTVEGETTNGSLAVDVAKSGWHGDQLKVATTNGSVRLSLPENFSAEVSASTVNGSIHTDFPVTVSGKIGKHLSFELGGGGGPHIEATTVNGSVQIGRA